MAGVAQLRVLLPEPVCVEARAVRVESEALAHRRVAGGAITLGVAADAGFEVLPGHLPMPEAEAGVGVVV